MCERFSIWMQPKTKISIHKIYSTFDDPCLFMSIFKTFQGLDFLFSNSQTFEDTEEPWEPCAAVSVIFWTEVNLTALKSNALPWLLR